VFGDFILQRNTGSVIVAAVKADLLKKESYFIRKLDLIEKKVNQKSLDEHIKTITQTLSNRENWGAGISDCILSYCNWSNLCLVQEYEIQEMVESLGFVEYVLLSTSKHENITKAFELCAEHSSIPRNDSALQSRIPRRNSMIIDDQFDRLRSVSRDREYSGPERSPRRLPSEKVRLEEAYFQSDGRGSSLNRPSLTRSFPKADQSAKSSSWCVCLGCRSRKRRNSNRI